MGVHPRGGVSNKGAVTTHRIFYFIFIFMEAIIRFKNLIRDIDLLFQRCGKGVLFVGNNELEAFFEKYIDKIRGFESSDIEDELTADVSGLKNNLNTVRFVLRYPVASLKESGYFPEGDELETMRGNLKALNGGKWANDVICGLSAVASWANGLISEVYWILDELDGYANNEGKKPDKAEPKERSRQETFEISEENKPVIKYVYDSFNDDAFSLTETGFCSIVEAADFSPVFGKMSRNKAKIKYMISYLSEVMGGNWYEHAAKSIGFSKSECSGAKVADYVKNKLDKSKIGRIRMNKQW